MHEDFSTHKLPLFLIYMSHNNNNSSLTTQLCNFKFIVTLFKVYSEVIFFFSFPGWGVICHTWLLAGVICHTWLPYEGVIYQKWPPSVTDSRSSIINDPLVRTSYHVLINFLLKCIIVIPIILIADFLFGGCLNLSHVYLIENLASCNYYYALI